MFFQSLKSRATAILQLTIVARQRKVGLVAIVQRIILIIIVFVSGTQKTRVPCVKRTWTHEEQEAVNRHFSSHIFLMRRPTKDEVVKCLNIEKVALRHRVFTHVRDYVNYRITKAKNLQG
jgi:hypothetical protein